MSKSKGTSKAPVVRARAAKPVDTAKTTRVAKAVKAPRITKPVTPVMSDYEYLTQTDLVTLHTTGEALGGPHKEEKNSACPVCRLSATKWWGGAWHLHRNGLFYAVADVPPLSAAEERSIRLSLGPVGYGNEGTDTEDKSKAGNKRK